MRKERSVVGVVDSGLRKGCKSSNGCDAKLRSELLIHETPGQLQRLTCQEHRRQTKNRTEQTELGCNLPNIHFDQVQGCTALQSLLKESNLSIKDNAYLSTLASGFSV